MEIIKVTVDAVIAERGKMLLIRRGKDPFKNFWALPGGFVDYGETTEEAVLREVKEETGLEGEVIRLVGVYSAPDRDPRGHTISVVYLVKVKNRISGVSAGDDAREVLWFDTAELPKNIAFDHSRIIEDALI